MSTIRSRWLVAITLALLLAALPALAGCGSCKGPPAEIAPAAIEEPADAGSSDLPDEGDTAMASDGAD